MKATLRIPTNDQYAFVEVELEEGQLGARITPELVESTYNSFTRAFKVQGGIPEKEFQAFLDEYLTKRSITNGQEQFEKMSPEQRIIIGAIRRSFARLKK